MSKIYTVEGNTSGGSTLVANGGCVAQKSYDIGYDRIAKIWRPYFKDGEGIKVVKKANSYAGYLEKRSNLQLTSFTANAGYNNFTIFAQMYKQYTGIDVQGQPWCDVFVDMMFILALGIDRAKELLGGWSAYTPTSCGLLKLAAKKEVKDFTKVRKGDVIFFKNSQRICHTGIIRLPGENTGSALTITESKKDSVGSTYSLAKFIQDMREITGYNDNIQVKNHTVTLSKTINNKHAMVLPVQKYLKFLGFYKGVPDRIFGSLTEDAVNKYQSQVLRYSKPDGEITVKKKMWQSLLGLSN